MELDPREFDARLRARAAREDCPLPEGFAERLKGRLERLPEPAPRRWRGKRLVAAVAAVLILTACTAGAATVALRQVRYAYFDTMQEAAEAATQAALEAGEDTAAAGGYDRVVGDFPPLEAWDLEEEMACYDEISACAGGGAEDGWTGMFTGIEENSVSTYYVADSLSGLAGLWPEGVALPDLEWLEGNYSFLESGQCLIEWEALEPSLARLIDSTLVYGACHSPEGAPVSLNWTFYEKRQVDDQFMVNDGLDRVEEYTAADGAVVTIEWMTSVNGQSRFHAQYGYGYADFAMSGAEMEPEEVHTLLDHMNLSALSGYLPG